MSPASSPTASDTQAGTQPSDVPMEHLAHQPQRPGHRLHRQLRDQLHDRRQNDAEMGQDGRWGLDLGLRPGHLDHGLAHREQHLPGCHHPRQAGDRQLRYPPRDYCPARGELDRRRTGVSAVCEFQDHGRRAPRLLREAHRLRRLIRRRIRASCSVCISLLPAIQFQGRR